MPRMCLWHAWSDVCWLFYCCFYCLKELNVNSTYDRHIPLQINHMSDIIRCNDFSTVTSERIIFLLCKLNIAMHTTDAIMDTCIEINENSAFSMEVCSRYIPGIYKGLEYVSHMPDICLTYDTIRIPDVCCRPRFSRLTRRKQHQILAVIGPSQTLVWPTRTPCSYGLTRMGAGPDVGTRHAVARHMLSILDVHVEKHAAYSMDTFIVLVLESNTDRRFLNLANSFGQNNVGGSWSVIWSTVGFVCPALSSGVDTDYSFQYFDSLFAYSLLGIALDVLRC
jgi:hypothetical protein